MLAGEGVGEGEEGREVVGGRFRPCQIALRAKQLQSHRKSSPNPSGI